MTTPTGVPDAAKRAFFYGAAAVGITAAVGNFGHVYDFARHARQGERMATVYALLPDILLVLSLLKLKYDFRSPWAWAGLTASIGFIGWAGLVTSTGVHPDTAGDMTARAVSIWLLIVAVIAAGLIETKHAPGEAVKKPTAPAVKAPARSAKTTTKPPVASPAPPVAGPRAGPETPLTPGRPLHLAVQGEADPLLPSAKAAADAIRARKETVTKDRLIAEMRAAGRSIGDKRALKLLRLMREVA